MVYHWLTHQIFWSLCEYEENREFDVLTDVILLYREFNPAAKQPHENDPGHYHHMPELYGRDHLYLNKLEMRCSDIMTRYCFCNFHADYPMKFGDAHKYLTFRRYKFLHEENLPVGETVRIVSSRRILMSRTLGGLMATISLDHIDSDLYCPIGW